LTKLGLRGREDRVLVPSDGVAMAVAHDSALAVDLISVRLDDFARNRNIRIREADPVKLDL
jgi:hypothetical protein